MSEQKTISPSDPTPAFASLSGEEQDAVVFVEAVSDVDEDTAIRAVEGDVTAQDRVTASLMSDDFDLGDDL
jgi:hypothetical protein